MQIELIPEDLEYNGKGPLMTARGIDLEVIWSRANQILDVCKNVRCLTFTALLAISLTLSPMCF